MKPLFLSVEAVIRFHGILVERDGCEPRILNRGSIESAVGRPKLLHQLNPDVTIFALAAAMTFSLTKNHGFMDGNKRVAAMAFLTFLEINGYTIVASEDELYDVFIGLTTGTYSESDFADWSKNRGLQTLE